MIEVQIFVHIPRTATITRLTAAAMKAILANLADSVDETCKNQGWHDAMPGDRINFKKEDTNVLIAEIKVF